MSDAGPLLDFILLPSDLFEKHGKEARMLALRASTVVAETILRDNNYSVTFSIYALLIPIREVFSEDITVTSIASSGASQQSKVWLM
jgi:hypothetical protein